MKNKINLRKLKVVLFGNYHHKGIIANIFLYLLLIGISFIFLYPLLQMLAKSFMGLEDLVDSTVSWIPTKFTINNYRKAVEALKFFPALLDSIIVALVPSLFILVSSSLIAYGFARHEFLGKKFFMICLLVVFLVPTILMSIPTYVTYNKLGILNSLMAFILPASTGFGLRQVIFILIFYQFFRGIPWELSESAEIDGATSLQVFFKIAIPMALPAFLICFLYSFVWYWNETQLAAMYLKDTYTTLPMALLDFKKLYDTLYPTGTVGIGSASETFNEGVQFAGTILSIIPLLIIYFFTQKWFVEGVDRSGITGL